MNEDWVAIKYGVGGFCCGIIFCSWFTGATPEEVALIRLPATITLGVYMIARITIWFCHLLER